MGGKLTLSGGLRVWGAPQAWFRGSPCNGSHYHIYRRNHDHYYSCCCCCDSSVSNNQPNNNYEFCRRRRQSTCIIQHILYNTRNSQHQQKPCCILNTRKPALLVRGGINATSCWGSSPSPAVSPLCCDQCRCTLHLSRVGRGHRDSAYLLVFLLIKLD